MSKRTSPTEAGDVNRETEQNKSRSKGDSAVEFGKKVGRSENLENEPSRKPDAMGRDLGSSWDNDTGRTGSTSGRH